MFLSSCYGRARSSLSTNISLDGYRKKPYIIYEKIIEEASKKIWKKYKMKKFHILTKLCMCTVYVTAPDKKRTINADKPKNVIYSMYWWDTSPSLVDACEKCEREKSKIFIILYGVGWEWRGWAEMHRNSQAFQINVTLTNDIIEHELDFDPWRSTLCHKHEAEMNVDKRNVFFYREKCQPTKTFSFLPPLSGVPRRCSDAREQKQEFLELHNSRECMMMARWEGRMREWRAARYKINGKCIFIGMELAREREIKKHTEWNNGRREKYEKHFLPLHVQWQASPVWPHFCDFNIFLWVRENVCIHH